MACGPKFIVQFTFSHNSLVHDPAHEVSDPEKSEFLSSDMSESNFFLDLALTKLFSCQNTFIFIHILQFAGMIMSAKTSAL